MNRHAVFHVPDTPWAFARDEKTLALRLRTASGEIRRAAVLYKDRYFHGPWCRKDLEEGAKTELFSFWIADLCLPRSRFRYFFELEDMTGRIEAFDEQGLRHPGGLNMEERAFQFPYIGPADVYRGKEVLTDSVVYQIFPERFANGDPDNDPPRTLPWGGIPSPYTSFGGDIKGITGRIGYLSDLGIDLIYLTPVFLSVSTHKYNIKDYYRIDPQFGTLEDAKLLVKTAHEAGIKVFFDAVFNHTGSDFFAFADVLDQQQKSPYLDWYHIDGFPVSIKNFNYYTFAVKTSNMPKLRTQNPAVRAYFYEVGRYWIREIGIDGWRLDVADEVDHEFWRGFRAACEEEDPKAALVGEVMHEASAFLKGKELDSIMNYPFRQAMIDFFALQKSSVDQFMDYLAQNRMIYMDQITRQMWNLLGSHDTPRFLTAAMGERDRLMLASAFQFLYIGTPYIYYGDEVGLDGGRDPYCRRCMIWEEKDQDQMILSHFKALIALRRSSPAFSLGSFREVKRQGRCIVFERAYGSEVFLCAFNNSLVQETIVLEREPLQEVTPGREEAKTMIGQIELDPMTYRVFRREVTL